MIKYKELLEKYIGNGKETQNSVEHEKDLNSFAETIPEEKEALHHYVHIDHTKINDIHRLGSKDKPSMNHSKHLDSLIAKHTLNHDVHLWRGIEHSPPKLKKKQEFHDKGFVSTSLRPQVAYNFALQHVFHIKVPKGTNAVAV